MGARITSWLAVNRQERLISATLGASTYYADTPEQRRESEESARGAELGDGLAARLRRENPGMSAAQAEELAARRRGLNDPLAIAAYYRCVSGLAIDEARLGTTKVPIMHIIGSLDITRLPASHRLQEVLPTVEFSIVEGATHAGEQGLFRHPEFLSAIEAFLAKHH